MSQTPARRKLIRELGRLIDHGIDTANVAGNGRVRSAKIEGPGWTGALYFADGQPGTETLQLNINLGPRHRERFEP